MFWVWQLVAFNIWLYSAGGKIFPIRPDRPWGPHSLLFNWYRVFPGGKAAGAWLWPPTPSSAEIKERVEPCLYSPFGPSWPVLGKLYLHLYNLWWEDMLDAPRAVCVSTGLTTDLGSEVHESWRLNCERWCLVYFVPRYATGFMSPFWRPEFWGGCCILGKFVRICEMLEGWNGEGCRMDWTEDAVKMADYWERFIVWLIYCY